MSRALAVGLMVGGVLLCTVQCGGERADEERSQARSGAPLVSDAILARERKFDASGTLLSESFIDTPRSEKFWSGLENGFAPDGRRYVSMAGASWDGKVETRYQQLYLSGDPPSQDWVVLAGKPSGVPAGPAKGKVLSPELLSVVAGGTKELIPVFIGFAHKPTTPLGPHPSLQFSWLPETEKLQLHEQRISARQAEVEQMHKSLRAYLLEKSAVEVESVWLTGNMFARVPAAALSDLLARNDVVAVEMIRPVPPTSEGKWDGKDMKHATGLNTGKYIDNNYHGGYVNPATGNKLRIAIIDSNFDYNHPGFLTAAGGATRVVSTWNCAVNPCVPGLPPPSGANHGSAVAGLAAGDLRDGQMGGTSDWQLDRTGIAEEADLVLIDISPSNAWFARGLQKAVELSADVAVGTIGGDASPCDGDAGDWDDAIYSAYTANTLVVASAGNAGNVNPWCTLGNVADNLSGFTVGALGNFTSDITYQNYSTSDLWSVSSTDGTSRGGINVTINGGSFPGVVSAVSAMAPGCPQYMFVYDDSIVEPEICGTSFSTPQVAGAAVLVKHWNLATQGNFIVGGRGRLFAALLPMTDRANGAASYRPWGFDPVWGGGRFQARMYTPADHPSGVYAWGTTAFRLRTGQIQDILVNGAGNEPSSLNQFKVYAVFFESDGQDIADIDVYVGDKDCGSGSVQLGSDISRDTKSMVRLSGAQAAGKALCVRVYGYYVPAADVAREVNVFWYYSADTAMR